MEARFISSLESPRIPGFQWQEPEDDRDRKIFRDILEHGCQVIAIEASRHSADYAFSVGLYLNFLHPEILIMGTSSQAAHKAINQICRAAESGHEVKVGDTRTDLFDLPRAVRFVSVPQECYFDYLGYAAWFYRSVFFTAEPLMTHKFPVLQALWPDENGLYPDDARCNEVVRKAQTLVPQPDLQRPQL
jgi:hypothetical protein